MSRLVAGLVASSKLGKPRPQASEGGRPVDRSLGRDRSQTWKHGIAVRGPISPSEAVSLVRLDGRSRTGMVLGKGSVRTKSAMYGMPRLADTEGGGFEARAGLQ